MSPASRALRSCSVRSCAWFDADLEAGRLLLCGGSQTWSGCATHVGRRRTHARTRLPLNKVRDNGRLARTRRKGATQGKGHNQRGVAENARMEKKTSGGTPGVLGRLFRQTMPKRSTQPCWRLLLKELRSMCPPRLSARIVLALGHLLKWSGRAMAALSSEEERQG